ncbi:MAG TPA: hypothetical protein DCM54_01240 [Gammaproteobacteria bacterium]|nr:hypothetical protein [Gammaproteobacteria bacterium]|tara:strand:- start:719 stop:934 length:216 start_codon:yes stop_codon:yes gene_type:complete
MANSRISRQEALSFVLTYIVVERNIDITLDKLSLFKLTQLAQDAASRINSVEGAIPHEVIEQVASEYLGDG